MINIPLVIPAAGLGSRLFPATWAIPKELFPVGNKPALHYLLEEARHAAIKDILWITSARKEALSTYLHYCKEQAAEYGLLPSEAKRLSELDAMNKNFSYSFAIQEQAKGVGNAMLIAHKMLSVPFFCMAYPDDLLENPTEGLHQLVEAHKKHQCSIIAVEKVPSDRIHAYGVIECGQRIDKNLIEIKSIVEKPSAEQAPSEYGVVARYLLTSYILDQLDQQNTESPCFISALNDSIRQGHKIIALELSTTRYDIGTVPGWLKAVYALNQEHMPTPSITLPSKIITPGTCIEQI